MKELNYLILIFLLNAFISTSGIAQNGYVINGRVNGLADHTKIYLIDGGRRKTIDSAVVLNEAFRLSGTLEEAAHMYLYAEKKIKLADILLDNRHIDVTGNKPAYDSIHVKGSDIDEQWKEWYKEDQQVGYLRYRLNQISQSLSEKQDSIDGNKLKQIVDELMSDRISLLKRYVKKYGHSPSGAVLPTLCTLQEQLTKQDFSDMYNSLTPDMQKTYFGREILELGAKK